jgi:bacterioferritin B
LTKIISDDLVNALSEQIWREKLNANAYLYLAGFLRSKGLDNIAKFFMKQHDEETGHSIMIFDFLTDLSADPKTGEVPEVSEQCNLISDVADIFLQREIATTESLNLLKKQAIQEDNPVAEEFLRDMLKLQRNEYAESTEFADRAELTGNDWQTVLLWDLSLKE